MCLLIIFCLENLDHGASRMGLVPSDRNLAEFEACILGFEAALGLSIKNRCIWRLNAICQEKGEWQTKEEKLIPYQEYLSKLAEEFEEIEFTHLGREGNQFVDALVTLASMARVGLGQNLQPIHIDIRR